VCRPLLIASLTVVALIAGGTGAAGADETVASGAVSVTTDLAYGAAPDETGSTETLRLDLYDPADPAPLRPAVVVIHGGGFYTGDKADAVVTAGAQAFAAQGFVVASVNYRLRSDTYPQYPIASTDAQHDVQAAIRWLRAHAGELRIDPGRIAVAGHSAGAITALRVAANPEDPGTSGTPDASSAVSAVIAVSGFLPGPVGAAGPRVLMLHGDEDTLVPVEWAEDTCARWQAAGGSCRLVTTHGGTHDATAFFDPASPLVADFLRCTIGGPISFDDVPAGSATSTAVGWATGRGIVSGSDDGTYGGAVPVSRLRFSVLTWKLLGRPAVAGFRLIDVARSRPSAPSASWAVSTGVLGADARGRFHPSRRMTRAELATAAWALAGRPVAPSSEAVPGLDPSAPHAAAVQWLATQDFDALLVGGTFRADAPARRVQVLRLLRGLSFEADAWAVAPAAPLCFAR
jgi:acetyl esterase/lipase